MIHTACGDLPSSFRALRRARRPRIAVSIAGTAVAAVIGTLAGIGGAAAEVLVTQCGAPIRNVTKMMINDDFTIPNATFANVPGAIFVVDVPSGQTQCVRMRFSVVSGCAALQSNQHCLVRFRDVAAAFPIDPTIAVDGSAIAAHSFEWTVRLSAGSHTLRLQASGNAGGALTVANWSAALEVAK